MTAARAVLKPGSYPYTTVDRDDDDLDGAPDENDRRALDDALEAAAASVARGEFIDADEAMHRLFDGE